jgi:hypothetical protein
MMTERDSMLGNFTPRTKVVRGFFDNLESRIKTIICLVNPDISPDDIRISQPSPDDNYPVELTIAASQDPKKLGHALHEFNQTFTKVAMQCEDPITVKTHYDENKGTLLISGEQFQDIQKVISKLELMLKPLMQAQSAGRD